MPFAYSRSSRAARNSRFPRLGLGLGVAALFVFAGCATDGTGLDAPQERRSLPSALSSRWTPPEFASRKVDGERTAVLNGCVAAADGMGFAVSRFDGATGRVSAARRLTGEFDGARQDTLEVTVSSFAPGVVQVAIVLRETVESGSRDERSGGFVASSLVRDRAPYDAFFSGLEAALRQGEEAPPAEAPLDAPTSVAPVAPVAP